MPGDVAGLLVSVHLPESTAMPDSHHAPGTHKHHAPPAPRSKVASLIGYVLLGRRRPGEIIVVSHSNLFYWWPVWVVGFLMAGVTWMHDVHAAFVRGEGTVVEFKGEPDYNFVDPVKADHQGSYPKKNIKAVITNNQNDPFPTTRHGGEDKHTLPMMHNSKNPGVIYATTLLLVIVITNVPLRGLWSVIIIVVIIMGSIIFALAGWWDEILTRGKLLAIHINLGAYFFISLTLFIVWFVNFVFFDRQHYVAVTAGQVRLKMMIGEGEIVYDTTGMVFQKQRSDLFRHMILGMGSGDLIIRPAGGKDAIDLPNVLFVGNKVREIQELIKEKEVVAG